MSKQEPQEVYEFLLQKEKKSRWNSLLLIFLCMGLGLTTVYFGYQSEKQKKDFADLSYTLDTLNNELNRRSISSEQIIQSYIDSLKVMKDALSSIDSLLKNSTGPISKEIKEQIKDVEKPDGPKYIIYLHTFGDRAGKVADQINSYLKKNGYQSKGIEAIKTPFTSRINYFHAKDVELANKVTRLMQGAADDPAIKALKPALSKMRAPYGQIEIWINLEPKISKEQYIKEVIKEKPTYSTKLHIELK